jgi:hypothetical protein
MGWREEDRDGVEGGRQGWGEGWGGGRKTGMGWREEGWGGGRRTGMGWREEDRDGVEGGGQGIGWELNYCKDSDAKPLTEFVKLRAKGKITNRSTYVARV